MATPQVTVGIPTFNRSELLREAIGSVLSQTFASFRLVISDNASDDGTPEVVSSFNDPRITYSRSTENIGMIGNFNRVIQLSTTELVTLLPDDDILYPGYLDAVTDVFDRQPNVGVVHTPFDLIDQESHIIVPNVAPVRQYRRLKIESKEAYLERSLTTLWPICFSSAMYRTAALVEAGGMRENEQPFADLAMWMRIALKWDYAFLRHTLVGFRDHPNTATRKIGTESESQPDHNLTMLYARGRLARRVGFLDEANLPNRRSLRYRALADVAFLSERASLELSWVDDTLRLARILRKHPTVLMYRPVWRLIAAQLGGRRVRRLVRTRVS